MANVTRARRGSPLRLTPSFELFGISYQLVRKNIWIFGPLYALPMIFAIHSWVWTPVNTSQHWWNPFNGLNSVWTSNAPAPAYAWYTIVGFSILWLLIVLVAGTIAKIMTQVAQLEASEDKTIMFDHLWRVTKKFGWRLIGLYIVTAVYISVGFVLLIVPGLIMIRRYFLAPFIMLDKGTSIQKSMVLSAAMSKPYSGSIWGIIGVTFLISAMSIIPFIGWLLSFLLGMFYGVAPALRYQELKKLT
jgi:hypothetical protein